ncbi:response regulator [Clostridium botulinum]|uniref:Stage 0 sporulation protein A homolog n=1 Tax=Clostridium botulinum (strain Okra / Type B1) TaxID=498213 RepID=B1IDM9_CLOBK|nr:response regulator [Clostridium botulinum]EKX80360.1 response regulator [Clostridium botulinum CFSAN001628]ACA45131.1 response regulator [Clostridium botulinum B1 str. Okra]MBD5561941.1 response regulator [Clostridium botulinum]MBD5565162.1 response regulator [Clostridium botulinum]MBD5570835.1 response regulator [Clostridium botulinum]
MRVLIIDDDINVHKILNKIINHECLGEVIKDTPLNGEDGGFLIEKEKPDIVIVDLLMPGKDGLTLVREYKSKYPHIQYIMLSQVSSKDMIAKAYENGIEFYISKPINAVEVKSVLKKVINSGIMKKKLGNIDFILKKEDEDNYTSKIKSIMNKLGILGESGCEDIIKSIEFIIENNSKDTYTLKELFKEISDKPKSIEQRIRRTAFVALNNIANLGLEDYMNDIFVEFSNSIFSFEEVKKEMDYIRGKSSEKGSVNVKKFLQGITYYINK